MTAWRYYTVEITSASVSNLLTAINSHGYYLRNIQYLDELRISADISGADYLKLLKFIKTRGDSVKKVASRGAFFVIQNILQRPVLFVWCIVWLFLVMYLPTRVLFVYVDGNTDVNTARIIDAAEKSGICFGASRRYVRSEKVKNKLLSEIDSLQWAGINTYGCVAVISVKERVPQQQDTQEQVFTSIVAVHDGIITHANVTSGNMLCQIGQAVRRGQLLVSGFTDCGLSVRVERAEAEIMALTKRYISAVTPTNGTNRISVNKSETKYSIQIGKNIVKLSSNSSISDNECVKIYTQRFLTLPGGFELPVSLISEQIYKYNVQQISISNTGKFTWMKESAEAYLLKNMVAGRILRSQAEPELYDGLCCLNGVYACSEMIGQVQVEKIGEYNG